MRDYEPIWRKLKQHGIVSITANRLLHPRIIKAVTKEKWMDIGFKLEIEPKFAFLSHTATHSMLTFKLEIKYSIDRRSRPQLEHTDL